MEIVTRRLLDHWHRFIMDDDVESLERAHVIARRMIRFQLVNTPDELRLVAQVVNRHAQVSGEPVRQALCGIANVCQANMVIESFSDRVHSGLANLAKIPIKCSVYECPSHPDHLFQTGGNDEVEVASYHPPRFMEG